MISLLLNIDNGYMGSLAHMFWILAFFGSAVIVFIYLWRKGRLDFDEEPKWTLFDQDELEDEEKGNDSRK